MCVGRGGGGVRVCVNNAINSARCDDSAKGVGNETR